MTKFIIVHSVVHRPDLPENLEKPYVVDVFGAWGQRLRTAMNTLKATYEQSSVLFIGLAGMKTLKNLMLFYVFGAWGQRLRTAMNKLKATYEQSS